MTNEQGSQTLLPHCIFENGLTLTLTCSISVLVGNPGVLNKRDINILDKLVESESFTNVTLIVSFDSFTRLNICRISLSIL